MNVSALNGNAAVGYESKPQSIQDAAEAFEALFMGQLLKSAREARSSNGEEDNSASPMMELADEHLAQQISKGGGCGLAKAIVEQLGREG